MVRFRVCEVSKLFIPGYGELKQSNHFGGFMDNLVVNIKHIVPLIL
jgi:hypothetical protein